MYHYFCMPIIMGFRNPVFFFWLHPCVCMLMFFTCCGRIHETACRVVLHLDFIQFFSLLHICNYMSGILSDTFYIPCTTIRSVEDFTGYNRPGIKCKNGHLETASRIIDRFYLVDKIFAQFFLLDESCIYSAHIST